MGKSKRQYPSKRKSKNFKFRLKNNEKIRSRRENHNSESQDYEMELDSAIADVEAHKITDVSPSDCDDVCENMSVSDHVGEPSDDSMDADSLNSSYENPKKPYYNKIKSTNYKYRQKRFSSSTSEESNVHEDSGDEGIHMTEFQENDISKINVSNEMKCSTEISTSNNRYVSTATFDPESSSNYPIILENCRKMPVQLLLDDELTPTEMKSLKKNNLDASKSSDSGCDSEESSNDKSNPICDTEESCSSAKERTDRFILDAIHFSQEIVRSYEDHKSAISTCTIGQWKLKREKIRHYGLVTKFTFQCENCLGTDFVFSEGCEEHLMDLNTAVVAGTITSGIGHTQLEQIFASMGIHCMTDKTYTGLQSNICQDTFEEATKKSMEEAMAEEIKLAKKNGDVTKDGIPFITVIIDGSWLKRTYGSHWNSCSGCAAIIGARTGKVLFFGIRNKYCLICARASNRGEEVKEHRCKKNWDSRQPSTAMESDIILEGFRQSIEKYNVIYKTVIMDNDSSLYKAIVDSNVYLKYDIVPKRILCSVHLSKNTCKNLRKAAQSTQTGQKGKRGIGAMRELIKKNIETMRLFLKEAIDSRVKDKKTEWKTKIEELRYDILNIPSHVFGEHKMCRNRGLKCVKTKKKNLVPQLKSFGLYDKIEKVFRDLSCHSESLLFKKSTNIVELLNSLICRALGGKRVNWGLKSQYNTRVTGQVLQFNTGNAMSAFYNMRDKDIPQVLEKVETKRQAKMVETRNRRLRYGSYRGGRDKSQFGSKSAGKFYGKHHEDIDISQEDMELQSQLWMDDLKEHQENRARIERETADRSNTDLRISLQKKMLDSRHFQTACSWKTSTSCQSRVETILYPSQKFNPEAEVYALDKEKTLKMNISKKKKCAITDCGVFIDETHSFLSASPTALLGEDGILQLVCPFDVKNISVEQAIQKNADLKKMFCTGNHDVLNEKGEAFYTIQGMLHITKRRYCLLVLSTEVDDKMVQINVNDTFWKNNMEIQLTSFFHKCLLPELVNSRYNRRMPIRNPPETSQILNEKEEKNKENESLSKKKAVKRKLDGSVQEEKEEDCEFVASYKITSRSEDSNEWFRNFADNRLLRWHYLRKIIMTEFEWLNDDVMDKVVRMFKEQVECPFEIQSTMYIERPEATQPVTRSSVQIIGGNCIGHWRTAHFDFNTKKVCIYDSLFDSIKLSAEELKYFRIRFNSGLKKTDISFKPMKVQQQDGSSCGLFAIAYAVSLYFKEDPSQISYVTQGMVLRRHLSYLISRNQIERFPTTN